MSDPGQAANPRAFRCLEVRVASGAVPVQLQVMRVRGADQTGERRFPDSLKSTQTWVPYVGKRLTLVFPLNTYSGLLLSLRFSLCSFPITSSSSHVPCHLQSQVISFSQGPLCLLQDPVTLGAKYSKLLALGTFVAPGLG